MKIEFSDGRGNTLIKEKNSKFLKKIGATSEEIKKGYWAFYFDRPNPEEKPNCKEGYILTWHYIGNLSEKKLNCPVTGHLHYVPKSSNENFCSCCKVKQKLV